MVQIPAAPSTLSSRLCAREYSLPDAGTFLGPTSILKSLGCWALCMPSEGGGQDDSYHCYHGNADHPSLLSNARSFQNWEDCRGGMETLTSFPNRKPRKEQSPPSLCPGSNGYSLRGCWVSGILAIFPDQTNDPWSGRFGTWNLTLLEWS